VIWHFLEVWLLLVAAYVLGSIAGSFLYLGLERSPLAAAQGALADAVGDWIDGIKTRYGVGPAWRPDVKRAAARSWRAARGRRVDEDGEEEVALEPPSAAALSAEAAYAREELAFDDGPDADWMDERAEPSWREAGEDHLDFDEPEADGEAVAAVNGVEAAPLQPFLDLPAMRPAGLPAPRNGVADDLQRIRGIGRRNEQLLNSLGIFHFGQIAAWTPAEARWVAAFLAFPERIERDDWIGQATILASGGHTGYVKSRRKEAEEES
jgi:predicted flap endonuclease-1-like 5' DNA nuclease